MSRCCAEEITYGYALYVKGDERKTLDLVLEENKPVEKEDIVAAKNVNI